MRVLSLGLSVCAGAVCFCFALILRMRGPAPAPDSLPPSPLVPLGGSVIDSFLLFDTDHDGVISKDDTKMAFRRSSFSNASTGHKVGCGRTGAGGRRLF